MSFCWMGAMLLLKIEPCVCGALRPVPFRANRRAGRADLIFQDYATEEGLKFKRKCLPHIDNTEQPFYNDVESSGRVNCRGDAERQRIESMSLRGAMALSLERAVRRGNRFWSLTKTHHGGRADCFPKGMLRNRRDLRVCDPSTPSSQ